MADTETGAGPTIEKMRRDYTDYANAKAEETREAQEARRYYHGVQWTADAIAELNKRKQPVVTYNRVSRKVDGVVGVLERLRQDPKAYARTPAHEQGAELATAVMRYATDVVQWPDKESDGVRACGVEGIAVVELGLDQGDHQDPEIGLSTVDDGFYYDPRSTKQDFSDARYMGVAKWTDFDVAAEMFPDSAGLLSAEMDAGMASQVEGQMDRERRWLDSRRKRVFLVEHWYVQGGQWLFRVYAGQIILSEGVSPFVDEKNRTMCRYIAWSAYVDHDGDRYGFVRNLKSPQDEVNARRSKALHIMNTRRVKATKGAVDDVEKARTEVARPDGWIVVNPGSDLEFDDAQRGQELQAHTAYLEEAKNEIERFGPNPALLGETTGAASGRAMQIQQQAGLSELGPFLKAYRSWKLRIYRAMWSNIQRHWTAERWIRVTDDEQVAQYIQINGVQVDDYGYPQLVNAIGSLDVDIIMDEGPDTITMMEDTLQILEAMARSGAPIPPQVAIKLSNLPSSTKTEIMEMLEQAQQPDPMAQQAQMAQLQLQMADMQAKTEKTASETEENRAQTAKIIHEIMNPKPAAAPRAAQSQAQAAF